MKAVIFVVLAVACFLAVESANHNRKHKAKHENNSGDGEEDQWPAPQAISDFEVPPMFSGGSGNTTSTDNDAEASSSSPSPNKQHARANQKHHTRP